MSDLGEREADCGCCTIVDTVALRELQAASCGGCGCAERLRAEAAKSWGATRQAVALEFAADFLDAAPDARGSDLSAEQPAPRVSDLTGVYQSTSEPKTTMDDWLAARHDDQEATDG